MANKVIKKSASAGTFTISSDDKALKVSGQVDGGVFNIDGFAADFKVTVKGNTVTLTESDKDTALTSVTFTLKALKSATLKFVDGALTVTQTAEGVKVGTTLVGKGLLLSAVTLDEANAYDPDGATAAPSTGSTFTLTDSSDFYSANATSDAARSTAGNDWFRAAADGTLNDSDYIDGGAGTDKLTAVIADITAATKTITPVLTSVENVEVSFTNGHADDFLTTLALGDSTGVTTVTATVASDVNAAVSGIAKSTTLTFKTGGATAAATAVYSDLTTATDANGGGSDAATVNLSNGDFVSLTTAGIETLTINASGKAGDIDNLVAAALEKLVITGGVADADSTTETLAIGTAGTNANDAIDFAGLDTPTDGTQEVAEIDASTSTGDITLVVDDSVSLNVKGGAGKLTLANTSAGAAGVTGTAAVTVTAGAGALAVTLEGGANANDATALTYVRVTGSAAKDTVNIAGVVGPTNITSTTADESKQANAIISTAGGDDTVTVDGSVVDVNTGEGNDTIVVTTQASITADDKINLGAGSADVVETSEASLNTDDADWMAYFVGADVIKTTAAGTKVINIADLGTVTSAVVKEHTAVTQAGTTANAGLAAITFTSNNTTNSITLLADTTYTGQAGGTSTATGGNGGAGLVLAATLDNGANSVTLAVTDAVTITGGAGGAGATNGNGGNGAVAIDATEYETLNLVLKATDTTADTVTFAGGALGALAGTGANGTASNTGIKIGANATINITQSISGDALATTVSSINLNDVVGNNVNLNASTLTGGVTIDSTQGNATVTTGAGNDSITTSAGIDTITVGAGTDTVTSGAGADTISFAGDTNKRDTSVYVADAYATVADLDTITGFDLGSAATDDALDMTATADITAAVTTAVNVAAATVDPADDVITATVSAKGLITLAGAGAANVNTLTEWLAVADIAGVVEASTQAAFVFGNDTYVVEMTAGGGIDTVVKLVGVQATGLAITAGSSTTDVFIA